MARGLNRVQLIGNCGVEPKVINTAQGSSMATLSLATSDSYKDKTGMRVDQTEWHSLVFFNKLADIVAQYVKKGQKLYVEGKIQTRKYQDKNSGEDRYKTQILVDRLIMLDNNNSDSSSGTADVSKPSSDLPFDDQIPF